MRGRYISSTYPVLCLLAMCQSCESDVDFKGDESVPKMVVNSIINAEEEKQVLKLSESMFAFGLQAPQPLDEVVLQLAVNGDEMPLTFKETIEQQQYYNYHINLNPGDKVEIASKSPKHTTVYGMDYVPEPANITGIQTEWFTRKTDNRSYLRMLITIRDKPGEKNYYRIIIRGKTLYESNPVSYESVDWVNYNVYVDQESLFDHIPSTPWDEESNTYRIFSDELIDGREYTLNVYVKEDKEDLWGLHPQTFMKVEIHTLSENLYRYLHSVELADGGDNFTEPVKIFSNINGGYGVLGIYTINDKIVEITR